LRDAIENTRPNWSEKDRANLAFISRFGDDTARHLLKASYVCSLECRYSIA
jgi:hypothetical protein